MLRSIELQNFKCFGEPARIPIAPITLIFGQNSAGKSSILQAFYLLMQTRRCGDGDIPLLFRAENGLADLGNFEELVYDHEYDSRCISIRVDVDFECPRTANEQTKRWFKSIDADTMGLKIAFQRANDGEVGLHAFELYVGNDAEPLARFECSGTLPDCDPDDPFAPNCFTCVKLSRNPKYWACDFEGKAEQCRSIEEVKARWQRDLAEKMATSSPELVESEETFTRWMENLLEDMEGASSAEAFADVYVARVARRELSFKVVRSEYFLPGTVCDKGHPQWDERSLLEVSLGAPGKECSGSFIIPCLDPATLLLASACGVDDAVASLLALGPLRARPERFYMFSGSTPKGVGFNGERTAELLYRSPDLLEEVNSWLDQLDMSYAVEVNKLEAKYASMFELRLKDMKRLGHPTVALSDVGFGVSQILPLVVQGLIAKSRTILVEQPEIHIHPALQAGLGTFLAHCVKTKNNRFIVETHSEHLILRLQRSIRRGILSHQDVSIICVSRGSNGSTTRQMRLDDRGEFIDDWPDGFFTERLRELLD